MDNLRELRRAEEYEGAEYQREGKPAKKPKKPKCKSPTSKPKIT